MVLCSNYELHFITLVLIARNSLACNKVKVIGVIVWYIFITLLMQQMDSPKWSRILVMKATFVRNKQHSECSGGPVGMTRR